jgi:hypothetical protein
MTRTEAEAIRNALRDYTQEATKSPEAALKALQDMGIITKSGSLSENYGGEPNVKLRAKAPPSPKTSMKASKAKAA